MPLDSTFMVESIFTHCMDLRSSQPFWIVRDGLLRAYPALNSAATCDVIVLGGGITGALIALHLTEAGFDVIVLDKREIGWGSTSASTALLQYEIDVPLCELIEMRGEHDAVLAYRACHEAIDKLAVLAGRMDVPTEFARRQSLYLANVIGDVPMLRREHEARRAAGIDVEWLDARDVLDVFGIARPAALLSSQAAQVDAYRFAHALLCKAGVRVFDRTEAVQIDAGDAGVTVRTDAGFSVDAGHLVFATGYESQQYLARPVAKLISTFALVSEPTLMPVWLQDTLVWEHAQPYFYLRATEEGRLMMGGEDVRFRAPDLRDRLIGRKVGKLQRKFNVLLPQVCMTPAFAWAGTFGETEDGLAYIGSVSQWPRCFFALGYGGNGITYSVLAAEIIRDALLGRRHAYAHLFTFDR